jgi:hypothetical protein
VAVSPAESSTYYLACFAACGNTGPVPATVMIQGKPTLSIKLVPQVQ